MPSGEFNSDLAVGAMKILRGSAVWDPGSIADGDEEAKEITVTGAALGDYVQVSFSLDVTDLALVGSVTAANTVTALLLNNTGGAIDLGSGTVRALVIKNN
jgi:methenyltetrahydromethanopterin cyclohydrolase